MVRDEKKKLNREKILQSGLRVFADLGFEAATVRDIVRESGLAIGTFYNYFTDKETILLEVFDREALKFREELKRVRSAAQTPEELVKGAYLAIFQAFAENKLVLQLVTRNSVEFRRLVMRSDHMKGSSDELAVDLEAAVKSGLLPDIPIEFTTWAMIGAGTEFLAQMADNEKISSESAADFLSRLFLGGIKATAK